MVREPNGVSGQAGILASILKSDIRQVENLHLLVGGVDSCSLQRTASEKGRGRRRSEMPWEPEEVWAGIVLEPDGAKDKEKKPLEEIWLADLRNTYTLKPCLKRS